MRKFKKICERSGDEGILPRRPCRAKGPLRKTVPLVLPVHNCPWKRGGVFLDSDRGDPIWELCCLPQALELGHALACPLWRPLIELHCHQQWGPRVCISQELCVSSRIRWVVEFRKSSYCVGCAPFSLFHLTGVLTGSHGLWRFHREASNPQMVGVILATLCLSRATKPSSCSQALHLEESFFFQVRFG